MKEEIFAEQMIRLEVMFNNNVELAPSRRDEYFRALMYVEAQVFHEAVDYVLETFKPFGVEPFPSISVLEAAVIEVHLEAGEETRREAWGYPPAYPSRSDYCQRCDNIGLYLREDGQARFCQCEKGRMKRASWHIESGVRKREDKIQKVLEKLPPSRGPVRGLHERNPLGFWEDTKEEYDRWMADKRKEIEESKRRREEFEEKRKQEKKVLPSRGLQELVKETLRQVDETRPLREVIKERIIERQPGEDEEEDEVGF
jgi:hypothetical protein